MPHNLDKNTTHRQNNGTGQISGRDGDTIDGDESVKGHDSEFRHDTTHVLNLTDGQYNGQKGQDIVSNRSTESNKPATSSGIVRQNSLAF